MNRPRLFCEFPAGLAAVSLRLQGGAHCRPPISRMGNKAGFSQTILGVLGLHSGQGAAAYWWAEADPDVAALLRVYPDPDALREVARIIRGWAGEEPRALWERLRAERRARGAATGTAGEVAGWLFLHHGSFQMKGPDAGIGVPEGCDKTENHGAKRPVLSIIHSAIRYTIIDNWPSVRVSPCIPTAAEVSAAIGTPGDLSGCVVYMDPPYAGTTGYTADLPRAEVVMHARDFAALGATVAISEAEAIPDLVRSGWHSVEITGGRVGAKRTFSKQQQEIITMNRPAEYVVPVQISIYRTPAHQELT